MFGSSEKSDARIWKSKRLIIIIIITTDEIISYFMRVQRDLPLPGMRLNRRLLLWRCRTAKRNILWRQFDNNDLLNTQKRTNRKFRVGFCFFGFFFRFSFVKRVLARFQVLELNAYFCSTPEYNNKRKIARRKMRDREREGERRWKRKNGKTKYFIHITRAIFFFFSSL